MNILQSLEAQYVILLIEILNNNKISLLLESLIYTGLLLKWSIIELTPIKKMALI
jgi:hypothetical protein